MMRVRSVLMILCVWLAVGGCSPTTLMKTPAVATDGLIDPFRHVAPQFQTTEVPVFIASTRTVSGKTDPVRFYTSERSRDVRLGLATVEVGPGMSWEQLTRESRATKRGKDPEIRIVTFKEYGPLWSTTWPDNFRFHRHWDAPGADREPANQFIEAVEAMLESSRRRQITIFVHGFNTKFDRNMELAGEFWHYMARDGAMISFDWPSRGSVFTYQVDKANADFAVRQFREFLRFLAENTSASQINIIGHSAGCVVVGEALRQTSLMYYDLPDEEAQQRTKIGRVVLAAPDMDLGAAISSGLDGAGRVIQGLAIYASSRDKALSLSGNIFGDVRLGRSIGKLTPNEKAALIANGGQWIDVTNAERKASTFLGHSYFHQNPWVSSDVMLFLAVGATPEERGLVRDMDTGFLAFPDDYEQQLPEIVEQLRAKYISASSQQPPASE